MNLPEFESDDPLFIATKSSTNPLPGTVVQSTTYRSYEVQTPSGVVRGNRCYLHSRLKEPPTAPMTVDRSEPSVVPARSPVVTRVRTGSSRQTELLEKRGCSVTD